MIKKKYTFEEISENVKSEDLQMLRDHLYYWKQQKTESIIDKLKETSIKDTTWIKEAKRRQKYKLLLDIKFRLHLKWLLFKRFLKNIL